jgi:hypothetical protein
MTTDALVETRPAPPRSPLPGRLAALLASLRWAREMQRRCERAHRMGHRLDHETIRRMADEVDAWVALR